MTIVSSIGRETSLPGIVCNAIVRAMRSAARRRAQRIALRELLAMSPGRLHDLGINAADVIEALETPAAGAALATRRAAHADHALGSAALPVA